MPDLRDDRVLVDALRRRDDAAFAWLSDTYDATMRRLAPDDDVDATWRTAIERVDGLDLRTTVRTWLFRLLVAQVGAPVGDDGAPAFDRKRFRASPGALKGTWRRNAGPGPIRPDRSIAAATLAALPDRQRWVLTLRDVDGWTAAEVGDVLDLAEAEQAAVLNRARARLRQAMEDAAT